jgi:WD40 repeat protein
MVITGIRCSSRQVTLSSRVQLVWGSLVLLLVTVCSPSAAVEKVTSESRVSPPVTAIAFAPGGKQVISCSQSGVHVHDWPTLKQLRVIKASVANLHCLAFSPNGQLLAVGGGDPAESGVIEIHSWPTGKRVATLSKHTDSVRSVTWLSNARLVSASLDREVKSWDVQQRRVLETYQGHSRGVLAIALLPGGKTLVSAGEDQSLRVWQLEPQQMVRSMVQHTKTVNALALRPASQGLPMVASAAGDRTVRFWQPTIGRLVRFVRLQVAPLAVAWTPDGSRVVASCTDGQVRVIDPETVKVMHELPAVEGWAYSLAVHPTDGSLLVGGQNGQLRRVIMAQDGASTPAN